MSIWMLIESILAEMVRSLKLDVKVWDSIIVDLFQHLGNTFCNSIWEALLQIDEERKNETDINLPLVTKPVPEDALLRKEKYIQSKYVEKLLIEKDDFAMRSPALLIWNAVETKNIQELYCLLVVSDASANTIYDQAYVNDPFHPVDTESDGHHDEKKWYDPAFCPRLGTLDGEPVCWRGCSLMHLACHVGDLAIVELLLQSGADINAQDFHGRTPLHHCVSMRNNQLAKYLMRRGARPSIKDAGGQSSLERTMELGAITDEELLILLTND